MSLPRFRTRWLWIGLLAPLALAGCRDDKPAPGATAPPAIPDIKRDLKKRAKIERLSPQVMKLYRMEVCYFGGLGLRGTRDAYLASLGEQPPSAQHIPSFGLAEPDEEQPEADDSGDAKQAASAAPKAATATADAKSAKPLPSKLDRKRERMKERMRRRPFRARLPYTRHIRSCTVAKKLKQPAAPELDAAVDEFEKYAIGLHKIVHEAHRYYERKQYEEDQFKRGKELHDELTKQFAELDDQLGAFEKAYQDWRKKQGPPPDKLDAAGELSEKALAKARALTLLFWAERGEWDTEAIGKAIASVDEAAEELAKLKEKEASSPYARMVVPHLKRTVDAAKKAAEQVAKGELATDVLFDVTYAYVGAVDANHQALARTLNPRIRRPHDRSRVKRPNIKRVRPPVPRKPGPPAKDESASE